MVVAFGTVDVLIGSVILRWERNLVSEAFLYLVVLAGPTAVAMIPAVRQVEGAAAVSLLGVDLGGEPAPARTWPQRIRTIGWFWLHLLAGAAVAAAAVWGVGLGCLLIIEPLIHEPGRAVGQFGWAVTRGGWHDLWLMALGLVLIIVALPVMLGCGSLVAALAPRLLGPTPEERLAALDARTTQLLERTRLARELHDSVGHALSLIVLQTAVARRRIGRDPEAVDAALTAAEDAAQVALQDLDGVLGLLREEGDAGRRQAVHDLDSLPELIRAARAAGQQIDLVTGRHHDPGRAADAPLPAVISREAYRIVQESLTNAIRHAPDQPVTVRVRREPHALSVEIDNPVAGPRGMAADADRHGRGLTGLSERVRILGGESVVGEHRRSGVAGWRVAVTLPVPTSRSEV